MSPKMMDAPPAVFRVTDAWRGEWMGPSLFRRGGSTLHYVGPADSGAVPIAAAGAIVNLNGVLLPGFTDHHVHLQLLSSTSTSTSTSTAATTMAEAGLSRLIDLGGNPDVLAALAEPDPFAAAVEYAGAFLTAPGGYPSNRAWAPEGSWREISGADDAELAVAEQLGAGASRIKVALNSTAGPVVSDAVLADIVAEARSAGLPVVAHTEGVGEAARAIAAGVDVLAHAPYSEVLSGALIAQAVAQGQRWISTLAIHSDAGAEEDGLAHALVNVRAFRAAGGEVLYGTDLGNGDQRLGLSVAELDALMLAGFDETAVLRALVGGFGRGRWKKRATWLVERPTAMTPLAAQLAAAQSIAVGDLEAVSA
jgi:imidazolonepropionase-like amidohydrolase